MQRLNLTNPVSALYIVCLTAIPWGKSLASTMDGDMFNLSLKELMNIEVLSTATITPTYQRLEPASVTIIDHNMIQASGARSILDLLEVYVPNMHYLPHHWEPRHIGLRGIIGDREDKYLLLVNGKVMNEQTHLGALSERDLPMLADIRRIDVIRGPGSVIYGPGAISSVINILTENAQYNSGSEVIAKEGAVDQFQSVEIKHTLNFGQDHGLYMYAGFSEVQGAEQDDAPTIYGLSDTTTWGQPIESGQKNNTINNPHFNASHRGKKKMKWHLDYQNKNWQAWLRYTRGGEQMSWSHKILYDAPNGFSEPGNNQENLTQHSVGYQQLTAQLSHDVAISENMQLTSKLSWDATDAERILFNSEQADTLPENHREDQWSLNLVLNTRPAKGHSLALGLEANYQLWGLSSPGFPDSQPNSFVLGTMQEWDTYAGAVFAEHQWQLTEQLNQFISGRWDKDEYTDGMWSPRWALVYRLGDASTLKAIASRSVRKNNAEELRDLHIKGGDSKPEIIDTWELIYQQDWPNGSTLSANIFYNQYDVLAINLDTLRTSAVAKVDSTGLELQWIYQSGPWYLNANHSFTKLITFNGESASDQRISANSSGYGNDLSQWSNHISKIAMNYQYSERIRLNSALRVFWAYEGAQDYLDYSYDQRQEDASSDTVALADADYDDSTGLSAFLDMGLRYQLTNNSAVDFNAYNLLGLLDEKLNKRMYVINVGNYQQEPTAFSMQYSYRF